LTSGEGRMLQCPVSQNWAIGVHYARCNIRLEPPYIIKIQIQECHDK